MTLSFLVWSTAEAAAPVFSDRIEFATRDHRFADLPCPAKTLSSAKILHGRQFAQNPGRVQLQRGRIHGTMHGFIHSCLWHVESSVGSWRAEDLRQVTCPRLL